jgi:nucleoside-diphosphate-sugar epimerase
MNANSELYLVTGAAGFVGSHLVEYLASQGVHVRAMVRKAAQGERLKAFTSDIVIGDLRDPDSLARACEGVTGVFHVAALFRQEGVPDQDFIDINVHGVRKILDASVEAGVKRFVHCSTNGVHSDIKDPPADETAPFNPGDLYQETKLEGEKIAMDYFQRGVISGVVLRPTMIYGPGDDRTLKLFKMVAEGRFFYVGPGKAYTHWVDVRDLANAFWLAMQAENINAEAFLIGGRNYHELRENVHEIAKILGVKEPSLHIPVWPMMKLAHLTEIVCKPLGVEPPLFRRRVSFFLKNRAYDISKAQKMLGFEPKGSYRDEIAEIIAAYQASGDLPKSK